MHNRLPLVTNRPSTPRQERPLGRPCIVVPTPSKSSDSGFGSANRTSGSNQPSQGGSKFQFRRGSSHSSGRNTSSGGSKTEPERQQQQIANPHTNAVDHDEVDDDNVWGDDADDDLFIQASQAVEAAQYTKIKKQAQIPQVSTQMYRYKLELDENDGTDGNFMAKRGLGGNIKHGSSEELDNENKITMLEKQNAQLLSENYTCKGEISNLRRKLQHETELKHKMLVLRQQTEAEKKKKDDETRKKSEKEFESVASELKYTKHEYQMLKEQSQILQRKLASSSNITSSQSMKTTFIGSPSTTRKGLESSYKLPNLASFKSKEVIKKKELKTTEVQTNFSKPPETATDIRRKIWKQRETKKQEILSVLLESVAVKANKEFSILLPRLKIIAQNAQDTLCENLNIEGFSYDCLFPESLQVAQMKLEQEYRILHGGCTPVITPKFPCKLTDWDSIEDLDQCIGEQLRYHRDVWKSLCFVLIELLKRMEHLRNERNSLYRINNLTYFIRLLVWTCNLWEHFLPEMCPSWAANEEARIFFKGQVRQWTTMMLWLAGRHIHLETAQLEIRKLTLRILDEMIRHKHFIYNKTNYERLHIVIWDTLTIDRHVHFDNVYRCLQIVRSVERRNFYLNFMCTRGDDETCLIQHIGQKSMYVFKKKKRDSVKRFRIYAAFVSFLLSLKDCCVVHGSGACFKDNQQEEVEEPDDEMKMPFLKPLDLRPEPTKSSKNMPHHSMGITSIGRQQMNLNMTVNSFYGSEVVNLEDEDNSSEDEFAVARDQATDSRFVVTLPPRASDRRVTTKENPLHHSQKAAPVAYTRTGSSNRINRGHVVTTTFQSSSMPSKEDDEVIILSESSEEPIECEQEENSARGHGASPSNLDCKKFLDCSNWEENKKADMKKGFCQCRTHLMEALMVMTEEMIYFWRHLKGCSEFEKSAICKAKKLADQLGKRENELNTVIKELKEEERLKERAAGKRYQDIEKEFENLVPDDAEKFQQMYRDIENCSPNSLQINQIEESLDTGIEFLYDAFLTSVNTVYAFGAQGSSAFSSSCALLLYYMKDMNLSNSSQQMVRHMTYETHSRIKFPCAIDASSSENQTDSPNTDDTIFNFVPDVTLEPEQVPVQKMTFSKLTVDEETQEELPAFLIQRIKQLQQWKRSSKHLKDTNEPAYRSRKSLFPTSSKQDVTIINRFEKKIRKMWGDDDVEVIETTNVDTNVNQTTVANIERKSPSDKSQVHLDNSSDSGLGSTRHRRASDVSDDEDQKWEDVEDYEYFCRPGKLLTDDEGEDETNVPIVTVEHLRVTVQTSKSNSANIRRDNESKMSHVMPKVKTAKQMCEELRRNKNRSPTSDPSGMEQNEETCKELEILLEKSLVTLKQKKYYKMETGFSFNDLNSEAYPVTL